MLKDDEIYERFSRIRHEIAPNEWPVGYATVPPEWEKGLRWAYDKACEDCAEKLTGPDYICSPDSAGIVIMHASDLCRALKHSEDTDDD